VVRAGADGIGATTVGTYSPPDEEKVGGEYDGVDAANGAGKGAIYPFSEQSKRCARPDSIGGIAVGLYPPPIVLSEGEYDGVIAACWVGGGAIDPFAKRSGRLARADGIGGAAVGLYSPLLMVRLKENISCSPSD
jgi:hypothetical protein